MLVMELKIRTSQPVVPGLCLSVSSASHLQIFTTNVENVGVNAGDLRSKGGPGNGEEAPVRDTPLRWVSFSLSGLFA